MSKITVKPLEWDEFSTEFNRHFQSNTILGQFQICYLGEFECWQLYSPQKSASWKENFSRHSTSDAAKVSAQAGYESRILSAIEAPELASRVSELEGENERLRAALRKVEWWAQQKCPCHEETPNPCPLCGASVENLEACKAVESVFPRDLLADIRAALASRRGA